MAGNKCVFYNCPETRRKSEVSVLNPTQGFRFKKERKWSLRTSLFLVVYIALIF